MHVVSSSGCKVKRITVLNSKGGCGKSMLATNLAALYASQGLRTTLIDYDPLGSARNWLKKRPEDLPIIQGIDASKPNPGKTRTFQLRVPVGTDRLIIDTPAGVSGFELNDFVLHTDYVLIPVVPSASDINGTARLISELLLNVKVRRIAVRVGVVTNRVRKNTRILERLNRFLAQVDFPVITTLRDTQNYVNAESQGKGIHELYPPSLVKRDIEHIKTLLSAIEEDSCWATEAEKATKSNEAWPRIN
ncbi:MAG: ParA family protein [Gammaproteobacteria bacterium]